MKKIIFISSIDGFDLIDNFKPKLAKYFMPDYLKNMPHDNKTVYPIINKLVPNVRTAKICPSFIDIYNEAIVLPAPCDIWLSVNSKEALWRTTNDKIKMDYHENGQFVDYLPNPKAVKGVFKLYYPYQAIVPKGYSFRQIPMLYDFNKEWHVAYGQYAADSISQIVLQIFYTSDKEEVLIKAGEPLCMYVPYKRENFKISFDKFEKYKDILNANFMKTVSSFKYSHRKFK